jgi:hypothetical protein
MTDVKKLPKWAQREIEQLRRTVALLDGQLAGLTGSKETSITVEMPGALHHRTFLPDGAHIRFWLPGDVDYIDVSRHGGAIEIVGSDSIYVTPETGTNHITIGLLPRSTQS